MSDCKLFSKIIGGWRKLLNAELRNLYSSPDVIRMIKSRRMMWTGHVALVGRKNNAYGVMMGKPEGNRLQGTPSHR
jgi:hypothetical protein